MTASFPGLAPLRVLAADTLAEGSTLQRVLGAHLTLIHAYTMDDAVAELDNELDAIICNIHFDRYRMLDLLRLAKADATTRTVPFLCFRELDTELGKSVADELVTATQALGACAFLDMYTLKREKGTAGADTHLRARVMELAGEGRTGRRLRGA